jgi:hypothetical protein
MGSRKSQCIATFKLFPSKIKPPVDKTSYQLVVFNGGDEGFRWIAFYSFPFFSIILESADFAVFCSPH